MPELPEVDTMVNYLARVVKNRTITSFQAEHKSFTKLFDMPGIHNVPGTQILGVTRKAKYILFQLDNGYFVCHNKFSGFWSYEEEPWSFDYLEFKRPISQKDVRFRIHLDAEIGDGVPGDAHNGKWLDYHDARCLGQIKFEETRDPATISYLAHMGPDVVVTPHTDRNFHNTWTYFHLKKACAKTGRTIKAMLLDQKVQAGIGNIYACEALWMAKIDPFSVARGLSDLQISRLYKAIYEVMKIALDHSVKYDDYINIFRQKECPVCKGPVVRKEQNKRGTYMCDSCQAPCIN